MTKNIHKTLAIALLAAIAALFTFTEILAQERPTECSTPGENYILSLLPGYPENSDTNTWKWRYHITCINAAACAKINKIVGYLPSLPPNVIQISQSPEFPKPDVNDRGAGDSSTNMGEAITNGITFTISPVEGGNNSTGIIEFLTDVGSSGLMSVGFNTGKGKLEGCFFESDPPDGQGPVGGIRGPGFDLVAIVRPGTASSECKLLQEYNPIVDGPLSIKVFKNPFSLCADRVEQYISLDCSGNGVEIPVETGEGLPAKAFSGAANQYCEEAFVEYVNSPSCFQYTSGGRTRYIPEGCNN
jgi:hypothetical protein